MGKDTEHDKLSYFVCTILYLISHNMTIEFTELQAFYPVVRDWGTHPHTPKRGGVPPRGG
jgi:hypothetical protein